MSEVIVEQKEDGLMEARAGEHVVLMDLPRAWGGDERAMRPPTLFVASLGGCVAAFVKNYCTNAGIDTTGMKVTVSYGKKESPNKGGYMLTDIKATIAMPPGVELGKRERAVLRTAESCVLHKTLENFEGIRTELADSE
jgi:uncharacterized OsmC-like protein